MTPIVLDPSPTTGIPEALTLDGFALHNSPYCIEAFAFNPAKKLWEWVKGADSNGSKLLRPPLHDNAEIDLTIRIEPQAAMDSALTHIATLAKKLQEAERVAAGGLDRGLELVWQPADATFKYSLYVQGGEIEEIPKDMQDSGWPFRAPLVKVKLYCHPFGYGDEVTETAVSSSDPLLTLEVADVPGDVAAEARLIVTDTATQTRAYVLGGLEHFSYDPATSLLIDSDSLVTSGYAGTGATRTGAYDPGGAGNSVVRATLAESPVIVCATADLTHIGSFRVVARLYATEPEAMVRLGWRVGRGQWATNPFFSLPAVDQFCEVDLGEVEVHEALLGTQTWQGRIEAKSATPATTLDVDYLILIPTEVGGVKARAPILPATAATELTAQDDFDSLGVGNGLNGRTAPFGGTWATEGATTDFKGDGQGGVERSTTADTDWRKATLGSGADLEAGVRVRASTLKDSVNVQLRGRNAAPGQNVLLQFDWVLASGKSRLRLYQAGTSLLADVQFRRVLDNTDYELRFRAAGSQLHGWLLDAAGGIVAQVAAVTTWTSSGPWALYDTNGGASAVIRTYDNYRLFPAQGADAAVFSGQSLEFRSHGPEPVLREDATGVYWGRPPQARGGRLWLPPAGDGDRTSRVAVMARRNDIETMGNDSVTDGLQAQVKYRPRWINPPTQP